MPIVKSYYRRSPGAAASATPAIHRPLSVSIYDSATGTDLLKARGGIVVDNVTYTTGLPGGFLQCTFVVRASSAKTARIDTGQKVIVRRGRRIVWWGWIEDIGRAQRGQLESLSVTCLGPWQQCEQRLIPNFTGGTLNTSDTIGDLLTTYCTFISGDRSHIEGSGVAFADTIDADYVSVASVIKDACNMGNSSDQLMLFAIWEPSEHGENYSVGGNLLIYPGFEAATALWINSQNVTLGFTPDYTGATRTTDYARSGAYSQQVYSSCYDVAPTPDDAHWTLAVNQTVAASAAEIYRFTFWYHFTTATASGTTLIPTVVWKTSGDVVISTSTGATLTATGDNTGWVQYPVQTWTAPATTAKATVTFTSEFADRTLDAAEILMFDDVEFTPVGSLNAIENKPVPWFWTRDTKDYDYMVYTARLQNAWVMTETTRQLANAVWASYGSAYTSVAQDATSQAAYRQRDVVVSAGDLDAAAAAQYRDTYLARWKDPTEEPTNLNARRLTVLSKRGLPVDPTVLRAGHRIKIMDGLRAGTIVILTSTSYSNNVAQLTPDRYMEMPVLLARVV